MAQMDGERKRRRNRRKQKEARPPVPVAAPVVPSCVDQHHTGYKDDPEEIRLVEPYAIRAHAPEPAAYWQEQTGGEEDQALAEREEDREDAEIDRKDEPLLIARIEQAMKSHQILRDGQSTGANEDKNGPDAPA